MPCETGHSEASPTARQAGGCYATRMDDELTPQDQAVIDQILDAEEHPEHYQCIHCGVPFSGESEVWVKQHSETRAPQFAHVACEIRWRRLQGMPPPRAQAIVHNPRKHPRPERS
jgi:hypothetical protein